MIVVQVIVEVLLRIQDFLALVCVWYAHLCASRMGARFCSIHFVLKRAPIRFSSRDFGVFVLLVSPPIVFAAERFGAWILSAAIRSSMAFNVFSVGLKMKFSLYVPGHTRKGAGRATYGGRQGGRREKVLAVCTGMLITSVLSGSS